MGLPVSVAMRGHHAGGQAAESAWAAVVADLREIDEVFSTYRSDSVVSRLIREGCDPWEVSGLDGVSTRHAAMMAVVLDLGEAASVASDGAFSVWQYDVSGARRFDPSGVVKGWAVQEASRHLSALPDTDFCLSAGGDLVAFVASPERPAWEIGVENPHDPARLAARIPMRQGGLATSGSAHRGAHVVHARTGRPPTSVVQVTVVASDLTTADIDATTAFALDDAGPAWLAQRTGLNSVVVWADGRSEVV